MPFLPVRVYSNGQLSPACSMQQPSITVGWGGQGVWIGAGAMHMTASACSTAQHAELLQQQGGYMHGGAPAHPTARA